MSVRFGSARIDENGRACGGIAGDQTGREVAVENWYLHPLGWIVIRAKTAVMRERLAKDMEVACANRLIGYDQYQNHTLWDEVRHVGWDCSKVTKACETDCARLVRVCCWYAGTKPVDFYTGSEVAALKATGDFDILTAPKYTQSSDYLLRGDILVTRSKGHTGIILTNGAKTSEAPVETPKVIQARQAARSFSDKVSGRYITKTALNIRDGAGTVSKSLGVLPKGTLARCYGYYTDYLGRKWLYVLASVGATRYIGFISSNPKYLTKSS